MGIPQQQQTIRKPSNLMYSNKLHCLKKLL